ncbi:2,3-dihydro-2,3-dihydroxybenzoate dehydrogenase [Nonomuraea pusilla]|uniref:2,3-dihydro-2,3-dihydroxybenzoate dehydrogenase n=1 Tax=Nonomuraea pusilla TaxID=46177 RepID=A0A1H8E6Y1_9ACTN|nr:2,3-dihydro-2,3-dihydroxybenzoate dehydrogenase [Nonomuraea pusilla]SEN15193.1 2,3-dihydro-2,3-dihydroxybenzoate dehydrogenase [Nonomuraea pusilla]
MEFHGRHALVTGAGQGIGAAVAAALAGAGAAVTALDLDGARAERVAARLRADGRQAVARQADVTDPACVERAVAAAEAEHGPPAILVNVAGVLRTGPVLECADADWQHVFSVNAAGVFHASRAAATRMIPERRGVIITVGSNAAGVPRALMAAYAASKAAATMFTKCLGLELAPYGIRCNVVAPGSTDTAMQRFLNGDPVQGSPRLYRVGIPLGRVADPADVAEAVLFLASDRARHITLHDLYVDGGASL